MDLAAKAYAAVPFTKTAAHWLPPDEDSNNAIMPCNKRRSDLRPRRLRLMPARLLGSIGLAGYQQE